MADEKMRRGQVSVWVIIAIVLVISIILFLLLYRKQTPFIPDEHVTPVNVESYIEQCAQLEVERVTAIMYRQGGFLEVRSFQQFNGSRVEFLCNNVGFYSPCVHQHPMYLQEIRGQIDAQVTQRLETCFGEMASALGTANRQITVTSISPEVEVTLAEDVVAVHVKKRVDVRNEDRAQTIEEFNIEVSSPIYNLATIANEIANQEAKYCNFETTGYSLYYPRYKITEYPLNDPVSVYAIRDTKTEEVLWIAIRSCAIPPGI